MSSPFITHIKTLLSNAQSSNKLILAVEMGVIDAVEKPLLRGGEIYPRMARAIVQAKSEILLLGYKLHGGTDGEKDILEALRQLDEKTIPPNRIQVRVLINKKEGLASYIGRKWEHPNMFQKTLDFKNIDIEFKEHQHQAFGSFHTKMLVIDGYTAILPSSDISKDGNYKDGETRWIDDASILHGLDLVRHIRYDFVQAWTSKNVNHVSQTQLNTPDLNQAFTVVTNTSENTLKLATNAIFISKKANGYVTNRSGMGPYAIAIIEAITRAEYTINIITPNMNEPAVIKALAEANKRGVQINIILGKHKGDKEESYPFAGGTNQDGIKLLYKEIEVRGNQHPEKLDIRWATTKTGEIIPEVHQEQVHARVICIDDIVFTGSSVLDLQSIYHSRECDVVMQDSSVSELYLQTIFHPIFDKGIKVQDDVSFRMHIPIITHSSSSSSSSSSSLPLFASHYPATSSFQYDSDIDSDIDSELEFCSDTISEAEGQLIQILDRAAILLPENKDAFKGILLMLSEKFMDNPDVNNNLRKQTLTYLKI